MNEVLISGFGSEYDFLGCGVEVNNEGDVITFTAWDGIKKVLTDPRITNNGKSVGERNIDWLHEKLDEWIKKQLEQT